MQQSKNRQVNMLEGPLAGKILLFAMPLAISSIIQQLFNATDVAVVGRFAGSAALAAVGSNSPIVALFVNVFTGFSVGANVVIAQHIGRGESDKIHDVLHTAMLFSLLLGAGVFLLGQCIAVPLLKATGAPEEVFSEAVLYLRIYFAGIPFLSVYNFGAAALRSIGDTKRPMACLIISGLLNVCLNLLFVIVFHMGVAGVALATGISNLCSAILVTIILCREQSVIQLTLSHLKLHGDVLKQIVKIGFPAAIQSMVFSLSNICVQSGINSFGTATIAGSATAVYFEYFDFFMVNAFNQAAVTYIGQNYAAGKYDRCKKIYAISMVEAVIAISLMILLFLGFQDFWIQLYTTDPEVIAMAKERMHIALTLHFLICSYEITGAVLRGMGRSLMPALITMIGSVCFRIVWLLTVFQISHSFATIMKVYPLSWILTGSVMITAYILTRRKAYHISPTR